MPIEIQRSAPTPITRVRVRAADDEKPLSTGLCTSCNPGKFYVTYGGHNAIHLFREDLREWCAAVIEMLDQDAP